jgi:hypothetical protein
MATIVQKIVARLAAWGAQPDQALHLERRIFGSTDPVRIAQRVEAFCVEKLGASVVDCLFWKSSMASVSGVALADGRRAVIKAHPPSVAQSRLAAVHRVQRFLAERGFPCPEPIAGPLPIEYGYALVEEFIDKGIMVDAHDPAIRRAMAETLAQLTTLTHEMGPLPELAPSLPVDDAAGALWPTPHNAMFDFEATTVGAEWIDELARAARRIMRGDSTPLVIGHMDWKTEHFRWIGQTPSVIHDWDSLTYIREAALVGGAAATYTTTWDMPVSLSPHPEEAQAFVIEYESARGVPFTTAEYETILAHETFTRTYGARCEHSLAPTTTDFPPGSLRAGLMLHRDALSILRGA